MTGMTHEQLFKLCGQSVQAWAVELSRRLDPSAAGRLLIAAAVPVLRTAYGNDGCVTFLRRVADALERDELTGGTMEKLTFN